ncbi:50S ribosomal protein L25/general stress protein Ctc [soil metagenome]
MSSQEISIKLEARNTVRKGLNQLRGDGWVPAVLHNHGKESTLVMGEYVPLSKVYAQAGKHHPVQLEIGGKKHLALIRQVDIEPTKQKLRHMVFQSIRQNEAVEAEIPVILEGDIPAEKASLMVITNISSVQVSALPSDLPDQLTVDATTLVEAGDSLSVADIKAPAGVTILTDPETQVCNVEMPRDQIAEADKAQEELAADTGLPEEETEPAEGEEDAVKTADQEPTEEE